jgi:hypothetical protein
MQNVILILGDVRVGKNVLKLTDRRRWTQIVHNYYYMYCIYTAYIWCRLRALLCKHICLNIRQKIKTKLQTLKILIKQH